MIKEKVKYIGLGDKGSKPKILIVENNKRTIKSIKKVLEKKCDVDSVFDGEAAIELAKTNKYNLFMIDVDLGKGLTGLQTTKLIKNISDYRTTPIIALTAYEKEYFKEISGTNLFDALLYKPLELAFLITLVQNILVSLDIL